ncbi:hypothetical protein I79_003660 [Cricetulus griseus]|uniref:Uncharacterized protein n=1 Tax=Cricetulus griseus TaxID=10029 RepID=G3H0K0_CRIGR|nr:hypothetical protein I79_003660 [Cricetulus griseus]
MGLSISHARYPPPVVCLIHVLLFNTNLAAVHHVSWVLRALHSHTQESTVLPFLAAQLLAAIVFRKAGIS